MIRSALHNLSLSKNNNKHATQEQIKYYHGIVVGIVSCLMHNKRHTFFEAIEIVKENLPDDYNIDFIIPDWQEAFREEK